MHTYAHKWWSRDNSSLQKKINNMHRNFTRPETELNTQPLEWGLDLVIFSQRTEFGKGRYYIFTVQKPANTTKPKIRLTLLLPSDECRRSPDMM